MPFPMRTTYDYKGYTYYGDVDIDYDDQHRKMDHQMVCHETKSVYNLNHLFGAYQIPTLDQFKKVVDEWST
jgi:hypothetical protein